MQDCNDNGISQGLDTALVAIMPSLSTYIDVLKRMAASGSASMRDHVESILRVLAVGLFRRSIPPDEARALPELIGDAAVLPGMSSAHPFVSPKCEGAVVDNNPTIARLFLKHPGVVLIKQPTFSSFTKFGMTAFDTSRDEEMLELIQGWRVTHGLPVLQGELSRLDLLRICVQITDTLAPLWDSLHLRRISQLAETRCQHDVGNRVSAACMTAHALLQDVVHLVQRWMMVKDKTQYRTLCASGIADRLSSLRCESHDFLSVVHVLKLAEENNVTVPSSCTTYLEGNVMYVRVL